MSDSSRISTPFTFTDLAADGWEEPLPVAGFVSFFEQAWERPQPPARELAREEVAREEVAREEEPGKENGEAEEAEASRPTEEDLARKAYEEAYAEGEKAGYDMGMRRVESLARRLKKHIEDAASFKDVLKDRYEKLAVELALVFAEAIVLRECADKKDILEQMVRKAMEACQDRGEIVVRVRAEDARYVEGIGSGQVKVLADESLKEPGFVIETRVGDIDGRISSQIEELKNTMAGYRIG
jgi:flagellar biosynthesis/type III secretory pathway protein FliH